MSSAQLRKHWDFPVHIYLEVILLGGLTEYFDLNQGFG